MKVLASPENKKIYSETELNQFIGLYYLGFYLLSLSLYIIISAVNFGKKNLGNLNPFPG